MISLEFMELGGKLAESMDAFDEDLEVAEAKVRRLDRYGRDNEDDFVDKSSALVPYTGNPWKGGDDWKTGEDWWYEPHPEKKQKLLKEDKKSGDMLKEWGCYICDEGLVFGLKYLVMISDKADVAALAALAKGTCVGSLCYLRDINRRHEWCSENGKCKHHNRPDGLAEDDFEVINLFNSSNVGIVAETTKRVLNKAHEWVHLAGAKNTTAVLGGSPAVTKDKTTDERGSAGGKWRSGGKGGGTRGAPYGGKGGGKGKQSKGGKGKGKGSKGGKGKGKGSSSSWHF